MGRRTRECYLCSTKYEYCPTCSQDKMKPTWMAEFHDENCKNIFDICTRFNMKLMDKTEAKKALSACDLSNKSKFKDYVQKDIANIFAEDPKPVQEKEKSAAAKTAAPAATKTAKTHEVVETKE